jgi:hypothetical protein
MCKPSMRAGPAGLVLAQLVLGHPGSCDTQATARRGLEAAAAAGLPDARWLLSLQDGAAAPLVLHAAEPASDTDVTLYAALEQAWSSGDHAGFLAQGLPLARLLQRQAAAGARTLALDAQQVLLLSRCAQALAPLAMPKLAVLRTGRAWRRPHGAAGAGTRLCAHGCAGPAPGHAPWRRQLQAAVRWLTQAGEQGLAEAWFVLSRIYTKPNFSAQCGRSPLLLERAADWDMPAQLECGMHAWRNRREGVNSDVRAAYWLLQAQAQGSREAEAALARIAPRGEPGDWASAAPCMRAHLRQLGQNHPCWRRGWSWRAGFTCRAPKPCCSTCMRPTRGIAWWSISAPLWPQQAAPGAGPHGAERQVLDQVAPVRAVDSGVTGRKAITGSACTA